MYKVSHQTLGISLLKLSLYRRAAVFTAELGRTSLLDWQKCVFANTGRMCVCLVTLARCVCVFANIGRMCVCLLTLPGCVCVWLRWLFTSVTSHTVR